MNSFQVIDLGPATLENYAATRRALLRKADELTVAIAAMEPIRNRDQMEALLALDEERKIIVSMIASCSYIIDWLSSGSMPGNRRGIERRAGYQREVLTDPARLPRISRTEADKTRRGECGCTLTDQERLAHALQGLTDRERECYVLAYGECFSYAEIAELLQISKSSVGTYMARAHRKLSQTVGENEIRVG